MNREKQILKNLEERNELVDLLQDIGRDWDNYIDECQESETTPCIDYDDFHADSILAAGYRKQEWISVDERLPDKEGTYLTYTDKDKILMDVFCIYPSHGTKFWVGGNGKVTHWMPLPEPPKMKGDIEK